MTGIRASPPDVSLIQLQWSEAALQELGLRDAAVFEAWVNIPAAAEAAAEEEAEEDLFPRVTALPSFKERTYPREAAALTSRDLERAARVHEPDEITYDYQGEILPDGSEVCLFCGISEPRSGRLLSICFCWLCSEVAVVWDFSGRSRAN